MSSFTTVPEALAAYEHWLTRQPLSNNTRRTYLTQVKRYCTYLSTLHWKYGHPLQEPHACDYAVRDYKTALKGAHLAKPSSVNLALAAIDHFYRFLELLTPHVAREDLPAQAPRALEPPEQKRFLRAVERFAMRSAHRGGRTAVFAQRAGHCAHGQGQYLSGGPLEC